MKKDENKQGFTIIEVILVLAIAGLIFLMVFIALPSLRRTQADAQRKEDITRLLSAIKKYQTNNRGALPVKGYTNMRSVRWPDDLNGDDWDGFYQKYLGDDFTDPNGTGYWLIINNACTGNVGQRCTLSSGTFASPGPGRVSAPNSATFPNGFSIYVVPGAGCDGEYAIKSSNPRKVAALYKLEGGGVVCGET